MKLWDKGYKTENLIEEFTVGNDRELDMHLAKYDIIASKAHATMLESIGILDKTELEGLLSNLDKMLTDVENGTFEIAESFEDVHSKIEYDLTQELGDAGKKIHTGRSRNDQVLVCLHLYIKEEIKAIKDQIKELFDLLIKLSDTHKDKLIPGYTHLQAAMPSSFGMWFAAYAESLIDDIHMLNAAYKIADQNPLGSGAGYGSSFPLNRTMTTKLMGFETLKYNSVAAQMSRGKVEKSTAYAMSSVAGTLSKLSMDITLYMSQNFGFLTFPDELTTGSSIMPHKKNPDVFELIRAKCNKIQNLPNELLLITNNLPSGYHRDLQLVKESFIPAIESLKACLTVAIFALEKTEVKSNITDDPKYDYIFSVDVLNEDMKNGIPFRDAYKNVAKSVADGTYKPKRELDHTHEGSTGNLCNSEIKEKFKKVFQS
ncbi:argininosuccinate lyase [Reichenbachiella sp. MALMAid0571]|uniref:argininosuccinate lyase n=1 Tax=Reichenbachiella sp. MALMAid0571 TaxID=3143939 RepID=UPI0032DF77A8